MTGLSRRAVLALAAAGLVSGCAGRSLWPFGRRRTATAATAVPAVAADAPVGAYAGLPVMADGTMLMPAVRLVAAERGRQGVILRAEGVASTQGFHTPELRPVGRGEDGVEVLELRARPPLSLEPVGAERTRLLRVALFYPPHRLRDLRGFRVVAQQNAAAAAAP